LGNSDLLPERALTWDMGVSWKREDLSFNVQGAYLDGMQRMILFSYKMRSVSPFLLILPKPIHKV
jgi:hypothetical protein